jgi:hypothetical protein
MPHLRCTIAVSCLLLAVLAIHATARSQEKAAAKALDQETVLRLLRDGKPADLLRVSESLQTSVPKDREQLLEVAEAVKSALSTTRDADAEAALRLALGRLAAAGVEDAAEWGFESMSVTHGPKTPRKVFESHVQALEMVPGAAKELMIGNLDVALNFPDADPKERQRLKDFVTLTAEAMRTRELSDFLDALFLGDDDLFVKIEAPIEARLIACYQHVKADPPINADAVVTWLDKHPGGPFEVELAALETISLVGTTKTDAASKLAERLLAKPDNAIAVAKKLISGRVARSLLPQVKEALKRHATEGNKQVTSVLAELDKLKP